ncbi:MAG: hypothetical protein HY360_02300, partial [Verrucomicrobia bacterium]|nr:hypothetical protein [Verrucomicrobiota bacterium]
MKTRILFCSIFAFLGMEMWAAEKQLNVYWADTPPVIDGKMDDACWQEAEVAQDFLLLPSGAPTQPTEVRLAYDARNLYVFFKLYEARMDQVDVGKPETGRDQINRNEAAEIQLQ